MGYKFKVYVNNRRATLKNQPIVIADNADYTVEFVLDDEWTGLSPITCAIVRGDGSPYYPRVLDENNCVTLPPLDGDMSIFVGLTAEGIRTTTPARIFVEGSINTIADGGEAIPDPEPNVYDKMLRTIEEIYNAVDESRNYAVASGEFAERCAISSEQAVAAATEASGLIGSFDERITNASDIARGAMALVSGIQVPTKVSELVNDSDYATRNEIPSLDGYARESDIPDVSGFAKKSELPNLTPYALKSEIPDVSSKADKSNTYSKSEVDAKIPSLDGYAKKTDIPNVSGLATKGEIPDVSGFAEKSNTYSKSEVDAKIPSLDGYAKKTDIPDVSGFATKGEIPNVSGFAEKRDTYTKSEVDAKITPHVTDAHINSLIDAKLGVIENGTY